MGVIGYIESVIVKYDGNAIASALGIAIVVITIATTIAIDKGTASIG